MDTRPLIAPLGAQRTRDRVVHDVLELRRREDYEPLKLGPAIANARQLQLSDDVQALDYTLQELVVAALATMERLRDACPEVGGPPAA